jgi:RimK family alpha-L-glutamate ligase
MQPGVTVPANYRVLIVNEKPETAPGRSLARSLRARGAGVETAALSAIAFDTASASGLAIPGFGESLPDAVLVRSISAGSFEAVTRRLGVLHALGGLGVPVWNSAAAIERCVDKSTTSFVLNKAKVPTPATFAVEGLAAAQAVAARELRRARLVLKPLFGAQGRGIVMIDRVCDLPAEEEVGGVYYLQHYVARAGPPFRDFRVFTCAGRAVAMMGRRGESWITNVSQGGVPEPVEASQQAHLERLAVAAAGAVGARFAGVDIVMAMDGTAFVLEVNSMPAWSGLQSVSAASIADAIADDLLAMLAGRNRTQAARRARPAVAADS